MITFNFKKTLCCVTGIVIFLIGLVVLNNLYGKNFDETAIIKAQISEYMDPAIEQVEQISTGSVWAEGYIYDAVNAKIFLQNLKGILTSNYQRSSSMEYCQSPDQVIEVFGNNKVITIYMYGNMIRFSGNSSEANYNDVFYLDNEGEEKLIRLLETTEFEKMER